VVKRLSAALHAAYDAIANEAVPERWVDLIKRLNEQERAGRDNSPAQAEPRRIHQRSD